MPPFMGPLALPCWTLNPTNDARVPSSLGMVHSTCNDWLYSGLVISNRIGKKIEDKP